MDRPHLSQRFGFLVNELGRLYSHQFDREARERLGLSQAQCRLLFTLATHEEDEPLSQAELAEKVGVSAMAVTTMCDRLAAGGWIERHPSPHDRRVNRLHIQPKARKALDRAMAIGDELTERVFAGFTATDRKHLIALLGRAREGLLATAHEKART
jgi:DNA-binding MarR family transcriptional regulator